MREWRFSSGSLPPRDAGGWSDDGVREVSVPRGYAEGEPDEMTVMPSFSNPWVAARAEAIKVKARRLLDLSAQLKALPRDDAAD